MKPSWPEAGDAAELDDESEPDADGAEADAGDGTEAEGTACRAPPVPGASGVAFADGTNQRAHNTAPAAVAVIRDRR